MAWSYEAFQAEGAQLVGRSSRLLVQASGLKEYDSVAEWQWRHGRRPHLPGNSYLVSANNVRKRRRSLATASSSSAGESESVCAVSDLDDINALLEQDLEELCDPVSSLRLRDDQVPDQETLLYEFHVVFHVVYQAPVLYFRLTQLDGTPVAFHNGSTALDLRLPGGNDSAALVSMEDHQVLGTPFYFLHPCETASAMSLLLSQQQAHEATTRTSEGGIPTYLLAWLSLVQPLTNIDPQIKLSMTTTQPKMDAAAPMDRIRKKPRLSLSSGTSSSASSSSSAANSTSTGATTARPKSGLMPPSINTSRLHSYAFGSRIPLSGKENNVNSTKPTHNTTNGHKTTDSSVKKAEWDANTSSANAPLPPKSALKRRPKRRQSLVQATSTPTPTTATATTTTTVSKATTQPTTQLSESNKHITPSKPKARSTASEWVPSAAEKAQMQTPPSVALVYLTRKPRVVEAVLSPVKLIAFESTTANDPEFWKARQQFARSALLELKALEERMSLLSEASSNV